MIGFGFLTCYRHTSSMFGRSYESMHVKVLGCNAEYLYFLSLGVHVIIQCHRLEIQTKNYESYDLSIISKAISRV